MHAIFRSPDVPIYDLMLDMNEFWRRRDDFSVPGQRGDPVANLSSVCFEAA